MLPLLPPALLLSRITREFEMYEEVVGLASIQGQTKGSDTFTRSIYKLCIWICANLLIFQTVTHFNNWVTAYHNISLCFTDGKFTGAKIHLTTCQLITWNQLCLVYYEMIPCITNNSSSESNLQRTLISLHYPKTYIVFLVKKKKGKKTNKTTKKPKQTKLPQKQQRKKTPTKTKPITKNK